LINPFEALIISLCTLDLCDLKVDNDFEVKSHRSHCWGCPSFSCMSRTWSLTASFRENIFPQYGHSQSDPKIITGFTSTDETYAYAHVSNCGFWMSSNKFDM